MVQFRLAKCDMPHFRRLYPPATGFRLRFRPTSFSESGHRVVGIQRVIKLTQAPPDLIGSLPYAP